MSRPTTALIIDDESHVRVFLRLVLAELGIKRVWEAGDGMNGLELIQEHSPQLVLLDLNLPVLGGLGVLKQIEAVRPEIPVVVISSQNTTSVIVECQKHGAVGYILKHTPRPELIEALREILDGQDGGEAAEETVEAN